MAVSAKVAISIAATLTGTPDNGTSRTELDVGAVADVANGTGNGQANLVWSDTRTLASGANETIDLRALTDAHGAAVAFAEVGSIVIEALAANSTNLTFGDGASEPWVAPWGGVDAALVLTPGARVGFHSPAGYAVANDSADKLYVVNGSGAAATYKIGILGRNA